MGLCIRCGGTKEYKGLGFMMRDCELCKANDTIAVKDIVIDKRSKSYKTAIKELMDLNSTLTRIDAEKLFAQTYDRVW